MANLAKEWGEEGLEDCQAITSKRTELLPQNNEAAAIYARIRKVAYIDSDSGAHNDASIIIAAYVLCLMRGVKIPNETVDKVLEIFATLSDRNIQKLNRIHEEQESKKTRGYVQ